MADTFNSQIKGLERKLEKIERSEPITVRGFIISPEIVLDYDMMPSFPESDIKERYMNAINKVADKLSLELDNAISSSVWSWSGGTRDIVDTGALKASKDVRVVDDDIKISYGEPYAALMHYGGYIRPYGNQNAQKVYIPGRPWIGALLKGNGPIPRFDFDSVFSEAMG